MTGVAAYSADGSTALIRSWPSGSIVPWNESQTGTSRTPRGLGGGLLECRLHFGPGYRIYLGRDGAALVILLAGGTKARQQQDIEKARELWREYKRRKREEV